MGFNKPTDIQFKAIPSILKGEDVMAVAQTGTGKTAAFAIPIIELLLKDRRKVDQIRCLVLVPTRELALQIFQVFEKLVVGTELIPLTTYGGVEQNHQTEELQMGVDILISTPGRLFDLHHQGFIDLSRLKYLILDESDRMLEKGFNKDIQDILRIIPFKHQTLFFSATINPTVKDLAYRVVRNPIRIQLSPKDPVSKNITHVVVQVEMDDKRFFLERYINENPEFKIMVFVRTKVRAERVYEAMKRVAIESITLHGDKEQLERENALEQFKSGEIKLLIATDLSARGIDIPDVDVVINYDLPDDPEQYVHRIGRTGRGMKKGLAIAFCAAEENEKLQAIEAFVLQPIQRIPIYKQEKEMARLLTEEKKYDWQKLLEEEEKHSKSRKKRK